MNIFTPTTVDDTGHNWRKNTRSDQLADFAQAMLDLYRDKPSNHVREKAEEAISDLEKAVRYQGSVAAAWVAGTRESLRQAVAAANRPSCPMEIEYNLSASKSSNDEVSESLGIPEGRAANFFRYAFLNVLIKSTVGEDGTVHALGIKMGKMDDYLMFPEPINVMSA